MNQQFGPGPRGNRGGRGHYQQGRFQHRFPNFKNHNYNLNNNNNSQKCYNQNIEHCPNEGEYHPSTDRTFANASGNPPYMGNETASYAMEPPMFHGHAPPILYDMPQFSQPQYGDMSMPPQMIPPMQVVNYQPPHPQYMPSNLVYNVFSQSGMMPPPQMESFNPMKDGSTRSQSRESFVNDSDLVDCRPMATNDYVVSQTSGCVNCTGKDMQSAVTIHALETQIEALQTRNRALQEENAALKVQLQAALKKNDEAAVSAESTEVKTVLSVTAEPFVAKPRTDGGNCTGRGGQKWPPDPVDQGYEKTCTELIEILKDKSEDTWSSPEAPPVNPLLPTIVIPVVSANGTKWSEMLETETEPTPAAATADGPCEFTSRGRVLPEDQGRRPGPQDQAPGRGHGQHDPQGHGHGQHDSQDVRGAGYRDPAGRGPGQHEPRGPGQQRRQDGRRNNNNNNEYRGQQPAFQNRGMNSSQPPDYNGGFGQMRGAMGAVHNLGNHQNRGTQRAYGAPQRYNDMNWRDKKPAERRDSAGKEREANDPPPGVGDRDAAVDAKRGDDSNDVATDGSQKVEDEVAKAEEGKSEKRGKSGERGGRGRSNSNQKGGRTDGSNEARADDKVANVQVPKSDEKKVEEGNSEESRERGGGGRSDSYRKGGSGDRLQSQGGAGGGDARAGSGPKACRITEKNGDLFTADASYSLAHCVAVDLQMGSGIAVSFRDQFKRVEELMDQHKQVGQVAILQDKGRFIYYLITKERSQGKPTMASLEQSLWDMGEHCHANGVKKLAMPRIGCGLDRLNWSAVKSLIERVFAGSGVEITVYNYPQHDERKDESTAPRKKSSLYIVQNAMNLVAIEKGTGFVYFCAEDGTVTTTMESLDAKHNFLPSFRAAKRICGEIIETTKGNEMFFGLVVKKTGKDRLSYVHLMSCLKKLRSKNNSAGFEYFGLEAFRDGDDELTMAKVMTIIRNVFGGGKYKLEVWVCFPEQFVKDMDVPVPYTS